MFNYVNLRVVLVDRRRPSRGGVVCVSSLSEGLWDALQAYRSESLLRSHSSPPLPSSLYPQAVSYMQQDLAVAKSLGDIAGECRAHGNLGSAYFSKGNYKEALTSHRYQLVLAMKCKDTQAAASALTSLGK